MVDTLADRTALRICTEEARARRRTDALSLPESPCFNAHSVRFAKRLRYKSIHNVTEHVSSWRRASRPRRVASGIFDDSPAGKLLVGNSRLCASSGRRRGTTRNGEDARRRLARRTNLRGTRCRGYPSRTLVARR